MMVCTTAVSPLSIDVAILPQRYAAHAATLPRLAAMEWLIPRLRHRRALGRLDHPAAKSSCWRANGGSPDIATAEILR